MKELEQKEQDINLATFINLTFGTIKKLKIKNNFLDSIIKNEFFSSYVSELKVELEKAKNKNKNKNYFDFLRKELRKLINSSFANGLEKNRIELEFNWLEGDFDKIVNQDTKILNIKKYIHLSKEKILKKIIDKDYYQLIKIKNYNLRLKKRINEKEFLTLTDQNIIKKIVVILDKLELDINKFWYKLFVEKNKNNLEKNRIKKFF